jgi:dehydrogenase/reductase SDR family member 7
MLLSWIGPNLGIFCGNKIKDAMKDEIVWITGASSGIGEALHYEMNRLGYRTIISARRNEALLQVRQNSAHVENTAVLPMDISDTDSAGKYVQSALGCFGRVDILVNNAGISQRSLITDTGFTVFKKLMEVNYLGTLQLSNALLPHFVAQKKGHYVVVTSLMGKFGSPYRSGYCGAKHALHGYFDVLRMEHEKDNIAVSLICPGFVQTQVAKNALTGNGSPQGVDDEATAHGIPVAVCAKQMVRAIQAKKWETPIGGKETLGVYLKRFFPKLLHRVVVMSRVR